MKEFSYQLYSSRNFPPLSSTLKMVADLGYTQVEGYGGLYENLNALDALKADLDANELRMTTGHFGFDMICDQPARVLEIAKALNMEGLFVPAVPEGERIKDAAGWAAFGNELGEAGKPYWDAGLVYGWHNHAFEFAAIDSSEKPLDLILQGSDDFALELDIAWVQVGGEDPLKWIAKYADRIIGAHIKDIAPAGDCADEDGWADVGHGIMDWPAIMSALDQTKVKYLVMEHDNPNDASRFARRSITAANKF